MAAAGRVKWLLVLVLLIDGDWAADDSGRPASASLDQLGKDSDCDAGPSTNSELRLEYRERCRGAETFP